jgi:uncharacterized protein DUF4153
MSRKTELGLTVLGASLLLGLIGETLRADAIGLNAVLWVGLLIAFGTALALWKRVQLVGEGGWLVLPALFFASAFAWRDSGTMQLLNGLALVLTIGLAALNTRTGRVRGAGIADYFLGVATAAAHALVGSLALVSTDIKWQEVPRGRWSQFAVSVGRSLLLALPLLLLFGGLFAAADPVFERITHRWLDLDVEKLLSHGLGAGVYAMLAAGLLQLSLVTTPWWSPKPAPESSGKLGAIEVGTVLGLLNGLFLTFVMVQFRYFFGGDMRVQVTPGLTYAEYARHGFFELVTVSVLVLPVLLITHWLQRKEDARKERLFRWLAAALVLQLFVVMTSAIQRMRIYHVAYGMTELRFYTTAFMAWLAIIWIWFLATVLRGQRRRFAYGALATALAAVALLDRFDPDAFIVRANVERIGAHRPFDAPYVTSLSADAVPSLIAALPTMSMSERQKAAQSILSQWSPPAQSDWRSWNWGRWRAWRVVSEIEVDLRKMVRPVEPSENSSKLAHAAVPGPSAGGQADSPGTATAAAPEARSTE